MGGYFLHVQCAYMYVVCSLFQAVETELYDDGK